MIEKKKIIGALNGNIVEVALGFFVIIFITRFYDLEIAGSYFLYVAFVAVLNNMKEGFLQNGFVKYLVEEQGNLQVAKSGLILSWLWDTLNIAIFYIFTFFNEEISLFFPFFLFNTLFYSVYRWAFFTHKSTLNLSVIFTGNLIIFGSSMVGLGLIYLYHLPIQYCILSQGVAYALALLLIPKSRGLFVNSLRSSFNVALLKKLLLFGKFGLLKEIAGTLSHQSSVFIAAYFMSLESAAMLGLANRYAILIAIPGNSLSSLVYPAILSCGGNIAFLKEKSVLGMGKMYGLLVPLALTIIIGSPLAIYILHGPSYLFVVVILAVKILLTTFLIPISTVYASVLNTLNKPGQITKLVLITSAVNVAVLLITMYYFGIWGAIIAPVVTEIVGYTIMKKQLLKILNLKIIEVLIQIKHLLEILAQSIYPQIMEKIKISVIMPTFNRLGLLKDQVNALLNQSLPKDEYEIIVVNDGSSDGTEEYLSDIQKNTTHFTALHQQNGGPAKARNLGLQMAKGEIIAFTDDDCIADREWLATIKASFHEGVVGLQGATYTDRHLITPLTHQIDNEKGHNSVPTCNAAYAKKHLIAIGGFDESFPNPHNEDTDVGWRMQQIGAVDFCPQMRMHHPPRKDKFSKVAKRMKIMDCEFTLYNKSPELYKKYRNKSPLKHIYYEIFIFTIGYYFLSRIKLLWKNPVQMIQGLSLAVIWWLDLIRRFPKYYRLSLKTPSS